MTELLWTTDTNVGYTEKNENIAATGSSITLHSCVYSVTPETVSNLMRQPDIDGCLVGGASLDSHKFNAILNYAR